uniref:Uncharacterized protein n=1 Tax=Arundo donax TaxID=35708 RepID=A0A0A9AB43_ARUDO
MTQQQFSLSKDYQINTSATILSFRCIYPKSKADDSEDAHNFAFSNVTFRRPPTEFWENSQ